MKCLKIIYAVLICAFYFNAYSADGTIDIKSSDDLSNNNFTVTIGSNDRVTVSQTSNNVSGTFDLSDPKADYYFALIRTFLDANAMDNNNARWMNLKVVVAGGLVTNVSMELDH